MKQKFENAVPKPRVPKAVLAVLHSKKGVTIKSGRDKQRTRAAGKRALRHEMCH